METEFVDAEQSMLMKSMGFNENCLGAYLSVDKIILHGFKVKNSVITKHQIAAPLWQQAFKWCLNKLNDDTIQIIFDNNFEPECIQLPHDGIIVDSKQDCLQKLIDIILEPSMHGYKI